MYTYVMLVRRSHRGLTWIDVINPSIEDARALAKEFDIHPLISDELLSPSVRQKTERYGNFLYLVIHLPAFGSRREARQQEMDFVVGKDVLITAHYEEIEALNSFTGIFETNVLLDQSSLGSHGGHLLYLIIQKLYRGLSDELDFLRAELERIERNIFLGKEQEMVFEISKASRVMLDFRRTLAPHKEILVSLEIAGGRFFGQEFSFYARLLQSEFLKVENSLNELGDSLQELRETNNSLLSTKQNDVMKKLTVLAFIFLPTTFLVNAFGMNISGTPFADSPTAFWVIMLGTLLIASGCMIYFKFKKWL